MPDSLAERVRKVLAERGITFRELVIDSLERALEVQPSEFRLRDAAAGRPAKGDQGLSSEAINDAIDEQRGLGWPK